MAAAGSPSLAQDREKNKICWRVGASKEAIIAHLKTYDINLCSTTVIHGKSKRVAKRKVRGTWKTFRLNYDEGEGETESGWYDFARKAYEHFTGAVIHDLRAIPSNEDPIARSSNEVSIVKNAWRKRTSARLSCGDNEPLRTLDDIEQDRKRQRTIALEYKAHKEVNRQLRWQSELRSFVEMLDDGNIAEVVLDTAPIVLPHDVAPNELLYKLKRSAVAFIRRVDDHFAHMQQWKVFLHRLREAQDNQTSFSLLVDEDLNPIPLAQVNRVHLQRYHVQLLALQHVYSKMIELNDVEYTFTAAIAFSSMCVDRCTETVRLWRVEFERNGGGLFLSQKGRYKRNWIMDDPVLADRARRYLKDAVSRKPKIDDTCGVFKIAHFRSWLNDDFLPALNTDEGDDDVVFLQPGVQRVSQSTALLWAKKLGLVWKARKKSYYVDNHDRADVLEYRNNVYLPKERDLEVKQYLWAVLSTDEFDQLKIGCSRVELVERGLCCDMPNNQVEVHVDLL